jgi:hypothetical protein
MPAHTITPPWGTLFTTLTSANRSSTQRVPVAIEGERLPTEVSYDAVRSRPWWGRWAHRLGSLILVSESLCRNYSVVQTNSFIRCPGSLSQTIPRGYTLSAVVRSVGCTAKLSKTTLWLMVEKLTLIWQQLWWTFLQSACQLHTPSKFETICHCLVWHNFTF